MGGPRLSLIPAALLILPLVGCAPTPVDAHDVAVVDGEEVGLDVPEDAQRVMTNQGARLLACDPSQVSVTLHTYGNLSYWVAYGCSASETLAVARRCAPGMRQGCAAKIVSISDGDPSAQLDPDMRMQSVDAIGMASLVTRGSIDLVCPPSQVLFDYAPQQNGTGLTVIHGCGRQADYVFFNGAFQRVYLDAPR